MRVCLFAYRAWLIGRFFGAAKPMETALPELCTCRSQEDISDFVALSIARNADVFDVRQCLGMSDSRRSWRGSHMKRAEEDTSRRIGKGGLRCQLMNW